MSFDPVELARWTRFAAKGGIGKCTAVNDCIAESGDDLMFLKDDEITVLMQMPESESLYLGYCEGVVGRFSRTDVLFHSKLKKPVMAKRSSVSTSSNKSPTPRPVGSPSPVPSTRASVPERRPSVQLGRMQLQRAEEASYARTPSTSYSSTPTGTDSVVSTPAVGVFPAVGLDGQQAERKIGSPSSRFSVASPPLVRVRAEEGGHSHTPSMSYSSTPSAPESVVSSPAVGVFPIVGGGPPKDTYMWVESPKETRSNVASPPPPTVSISQPDQDSSIPRYAANAPPPLDLTVDAGTSPLRILKRSPTSPPANHIWPHSPPPPTAATTEPDSSYSMYEGTSRRLSLGLDGEIGIGLSLLQDLANGDYSDDDDDDDWSKSSRYSHETPSRAVGEGNRGSTSTVDGLGYARSESSSQNIVEDPQSRHLSPQTSPMSSSFSQGERERRPSLAPSAGSASSWEGAADIYDDYRYSRYSVRPSLESTRPRTDSGKSKLEKVVEYPKRTTSMDSEVSIHTKDSRLSSLSKDAAHLLSESLRPAPLDFDQIQPSPLLHTNWATPTSSTAFSDPKSSSLLYTPLLGHVESFTATAGVALQLPTPTTSPPPTSPISPGFASAMRHRIETDLKSPRLPDAVGPTDASKFEVERSFDSDTTPGLGNRIVVEDEDELPSRILDGSMDFIESPSSSPVLSQTHSHSAFQTPQASERLSTASSSSPEPDLMMLHTHLAPLVVTNRTPSPSILEGGSDDGGPGGAVPGFQTGRVGGAFGGQMDEAPKYPSEFASPTLLGVQLNATATTIAPSSSNGEVASSATTLYDPAPKANQRRSLFLPHPNAPKPPREGTTGPMYLAARQPQPQPQPQGMEIPRPPRPNVVGVIRMALSVPPRPGFGPPMAADPRANPSMQPMVRTTPIPPRGPTIYGRTESDLGSAVGPVPIIWTVDPPPATAPPPSFGPGAGMGNPGVRGNGIGMSPPRANLVGRPSTMQSTVGRSASLGVGLKDSGRGGSISDGEGARVSKEAERAPKEAESAESSGNVVPRANFSPKAPGIRPRSRSFSGFNSTNVEISVKRSRDEAELLSAGDAKRSPTAASLTPSSAPINKSPVPKASLRPSPVSVPQTPVSNGGLRPKLSSPGLKSPSSPLSQSFIMPSISPPPPSSPAIPNLNGRSLRQTASRSTLNEPSRPITISRPMPHGSLDSSPLAPAASREPRSMDRPDADSISLNDSGPRIVSPPPTVGRQNSLRSKLSLPNLRRNRSRNDEDVGPGFGAQTQHSNQPVRDAELLQVQDMEFELVRPNIAQFQAARASEDSGVLGREHLVENGVGGGGSEFLRPDSPTVSMSSGHRSPTVEGPSGGWVPPPHTQAGGGRDSPSSMDAHRQRELKWISLMSSSPAAQARKSKKVKKLIMDGVPSSVRYLVWSYLTDGKARCVPGVYDQLCARGGVSSSAGIERDIKNCFADQTHLQGTKGPVLLLLQAYLNMVPDVQYTMGLTLIVGQLLLLSPEEDAFWIFISIMDTHIRPYFSITTTQMEVDSALFSRALENNDSQAAKKLLVDMGINPSSICQPWFSTLFVGTLPPEYLNRVWDLFLFEGVPFLIRVGLALVACCRQRIITSTSEDSVLSLFRHPPPSLLPPTPDAFVSLAFSVKVKDDDIRKQRVKMEAQIKRQTQVPRSTSTSGISLPRP